MRDTTCSVPDVASRGRGCAALSQFSDKTLNLNELLPSTDFCSDPDCRCARCLAACDRYAAAGMIPINAAWWQAQDFFVPMFPIGDTTARHK